MENLVVKVISNISFPLFLEAIFTPLQNENTKEIVIKSQTIVKKLNFKSQICSFGEVLKEDLSCEICPNGSFSLLNPMLNNDLHSIKCNDCPANGECFNGKFISPRAGFYNFCHSFFEY